MTSGGEIAPVVRRFVAQECQERHPSAAEACAEAVEQKALFQVERFCNVEAARRLVEPAVCRERLLSRVWRNWKELERSLRSSLGAAERRKMSRLGEILLRETPFEATHHTTHFSIKTLIEYEARDFRAAPPSPPPQPPVPENIVWEESLAALHSLTHVDEWVEVETTASYLKEGVPAEKTVTWSYYLKNTDGSYILYWSLIPRPDKTEKPTEGDPSVTFQLEGSHLPARLKIYLAENGTMGLWIKD